MTGVKHKDNKSVVLSPFLNLLDDRVLSEDQLLELKTKGNVRNSGGPTLYYVFSIQRKCGRKQKLINPYGLRGDNMAFELETLFG